MLVLNFPDIQMTDRFISRLAGKVAILRGLIKWWEAMINGEKLNVGRLMGGALGHLCPFKKHRNPSSLMRGAWGFPTNKIMSTLPPRVAVLRLQYNQAVLLLGSATPSFRIEGSCNKGVSSPNGPIRLAEARIKSLISVIILVKWSW